MRLCFDSAQSYNIYHLHQPTSVRHLKVSLCVQLFDYSHFSKTKNSIWSSNYLSCFPFLEPYTLNVWGVSPSISLVSELGIVLDKVLFHACILDITKCMQSQASKCV